LFPFFIRWKDQDIERLKRGGCYEREKQRGKGKQEGATEKPEREEKDEEGEEKQVGWRVSTIRQDEWNRIFILEFTAVVSSLWDPRDEGKKRWGIGGLGDVVKQ
jgi:hypothetical protein